MKLISLFRAKLTGWKANHLYHGGHLTLLNSVLTLIPTYWMSMFQLPFWVVKEIDKIQRDFLRKCPNLGPKGFHLVEWKKIFRQQEMREWEILNLHIFNKALLVKWWWKIFSNQKGCWSKIIHFNYLNKGPPGPMFHSPPRNKSYF